MITTLKKAENDKYQCKDAIREKRFNVCNLAKAISSSIFVNAIANQVVKAASFKIACPFKTGDYILKNMILSFPQVLPAPSGFYCVELNFIGKTRVQKKMEKYISVFVKAQLK